MSNAIVEALERTVERVAKAFGEDAGKAVQQLYRDSSGKVKDVVERTVKAEEGNASDIKKILEDMDRNASGKFTSYADRTARTETQDALRGRLNDILDPPRGLEADLGLSDRATGALRRLENLKQDPLGEVNKLENHNHYSAARREAAGDVVARKPDGTPFSHIGDLQQARDGLKNVKAALDNEVANLPDTVTDRGLDVLISKQTEVNRLLNRTNSFLNEIGHGANTPPYHSF
jgi:hypothetical protein